MHWTEPATADDSHAALEKTLWDAANQLWSNAALKPSDWSGATKSLPKESPKGERGGAHQYSPTVLGLIFLRYADVRFAAVEQDLGRDRPPSGPTSRRRRIGPTDFHAAGVVYLPDEARFSHLLSLPERAYVGQAVNEASRIASMCRSADRDVLFSSEFRASLPEAERDRLVSVGRYALRGVSRPQELFTLDPEAAEIL